jgi:heme-degrading monooxygenase HmoA
MYATVRRAKFRPGSIEEVIQRVNSTFVPSLATMSGFIDFYLVLLEQDAVSTLSVFETQSEAEKANTFFADWAKRELAPLLQGPPEIAVGEVAVHSTK